ncbi:MAG: DAK2 domain-containing protein [Coriobacteriales bacterium]|jgi:DAK2 domain fusion protein YloV|nr:DAK2 domain-containing protein [Coriobacteriales bacterium]
MSRAQIKTSGETGGTAADERPGGGPAETGGTTPAKTGGTSGRGATSAPGTAGTAGTSGRGATGAPGTAGSSATDVTTGGTASDFIPHIAAAVQALAARKEDINRLNVFPVPDGDTGTNMVLTMESVMNELSALPLTASLADIRKAVTHGSLMGARGNSGVITSQILRGLCDGLAQATRFDTQTVARALARAVEVAFGAVRKPVEGTILTVLRDVADKAHEVADEDLMLAEALRALSLEAFDSVNRTPDLLAVLRENNVVDAGGYGFALLIEGFVASVVGEMPDVPAVEWVGLSQPRVAIEQINDWEGSSYLYCTEFLLNSPALDIEQTQTFLAGIGDCDLLVGTHPDFKVHVHTDDPGAVLSYMTGFGQVAEVHIHNMRLQSADRLEGLEGLRRGETGNVASPDSQDALSPLAYIAVASGAGVEKILRSLGVNYVVNGGQTMNPSTQDLLEAIEAVRAPNVILFPNNKNIILAANAAAQVSEKAVEVVPTKSVPESFSALFVADIEASLEENAAAMRQAIESVRFGEVTHAIKDAKSAQGKPIYAGDVIGIADDSIEVVGNELAAVAVELAGIIATEADTLTILAGEELDDAGFEAIIEQIAETYPDLEIDAHRGDQPLYPLVMAAE